MPNLITTAKEEEAKLRAGKALRLEKMNTVAELKRGGRGFEMPLSRATTANISLVFDVSLFFRF